MGVRSSAPISTPTYIYSIDLDEKWQVDRAYGRVFDELAKKPSADIYARFEEEFYDKVIDRQTLFALLYAIMPYSICEAWKGAYLHPPLLAYEDFRQVKFDPEFLRFFLFRVTNLQEKITEVVAILRASPLEIARYHTEKMLTLFLHVIKVYVLEEVRKGNYTASIRIQEDAHLQHFREYLASPECRQRAIGLLHEYRAQYKPEEETIYLNWGMPAKN